MDCSLILKKDRLLNAVLLAVVGFVVSLAITGVVWVSQVVASTKLLPAVLTGFGVVGVVVVTAVQVRSEEQSKWRFLERLSLYGLYSCVAVVSFAPFIFLGIPVEVYLSVASVVGSVTVLVFACRAVVWWVEEWRPEKLRRMLESKLGDEYVFGGEDLRQGFEVKTEDGAVYMLGLDEGWMNFKIVRLESDDSPRDLGGSVKSSAENAYLFIEKGIDPEEQEQL